MRGTPILNLLRGTHTAVPLHTVWENLHIEETTIQCTHDQKSSPHGAVKNVGL